MKRNILLFMLIVLLVFNVCSLSSCGFIDSDEDIAKKNLEELVNCMQNKDREAIKALFAPNKISDIENFEKSIDELLAYYEGVYVSYKSGGLGTTNDKDNGIVTKYHDMSYDVKTTIEVYRIGIIWYVKDTGDVGNIGIWSFYILKFANDSLPDYSYRSEGNNGIHVATPRSHSNDA